VSTIGVGDDYNEDLMAGLAEASDANYYYVRDTETLPQIFAKELGELQSVAARDIRIEIICPDGIRPLELLGRPEKCTGQKVELRLNQVAAAQERSVFLRCRVDQENPVLAEVKIDYRDELNGGKLETISETARIQFTKNPAAAANSLRAGVVAQKELLLTAVAKDQALADADAGQYQRAAQTLQRQAAVLEQECQSAPVPLQASLRCEADNLRSRANELQQNQYDAGLRKSLQCEAWTTRNSK
jgi:Ca-activated chloride channel family protein